MTTMMESNQTGGAAPAGSPQRFRRPHYDVVTGTEEYQLRVVMPGVAKNGVHVQLHGRNLQIDGEREPVRREGWRALSRELNWDPYRLSLELNVEVNEGAIAAAMENGVLCLTLPKAEEAQPRRIQIS